MAPPVDSATHCERDDTAENCGIENATERQRAIEVLSEALFWKMEHLDPSDEESWDTLADRRKEFYRLCIKAVLLERNAVLQALS
jgi:hypothetical protein